MKELKFVVTVKIYGADEEQNISSGYLAGYIREAVRFWN